MRRFGWGHGIAVTIAFTVVWVGGLIVTGYQAAHGAEPAVVLSPHRVVVSSTLPPCGDPPPCSFNFGGQGEAYWISGHGVKHHVWGSRPHQVVTGWAHWATRHDRHTLTIGRDCWVHDGGIPGYRSKYRCP